jgi:hypothetical protein
MTVSSTKATTAASVVAFIVVLIHLVILLVCAGIVLAEVPGVRRMMDSYQMKAPYRTELVINLSFWLTDATWFVALAVLLFLALDAAVLILLGARRRLRVMAAAWAILVTLGLLALPGVIWQALRLPYIKLIEGLSR